MLKTFPGRGERALHRVAADDLPDIQEHRRVAVAELRQVQQHLALPRLGDGRRVIKPDPGHRAGADGAAGHAQQRQDEEQIR